MRKLLDGRSMGEKTFEAVDQLIDVALVFSPALLGPVGFTLYALLEPKDHLVSACKSVVKAISKSDARDYLSAAENLAAAHCLLTFTSYFEALDLYMPELAKLLKLTREEKQSIATAAPAGSVTPFSSDGTRRKHDARVLDASELVNRVITIQHPATAPEAASKIRMSLYLRMSQSLIGYLLNANVAGDRISMIPEDKWRRLSNELLENLPSNADRIFRAQLVGLAIDFPQFLTWLMLADQDAKDDLIRKIGTDTRVQFELVGRTIDLGLRGLASEMSQIRQVMVALSERASEQPSGDASLFAVAEALHREYLHQIEQPVIDDRYEPVRGPKLSYPTRAEFYVPQAYRLTTYSERDEAGTAQHLERDDGWADCPIGDDLGQFVLRHLESVYSTQSLLLVLGHPGSGKSLLTRILAARLAYPAYTTVRVELRDADPKIDIRRQIEKQIYKDTGEEVSWAKFARALPNPPVVILDGYDELLQATGSMYADYLDQVRLFQERESVQRRPVRVIVTSRITLIDKVIVPEGTTIARLEEFDDQRREAWTEVWNTHNAGYFTQSGAQPFRLPVDNEKIADLAAHPLLLLMLALYDSAANQLSSNPNMDQTRLYHELLTRFIRRELDKDKTGFRQLPIDGQKIQINKELNRLGVAAIGMFNRQAATIRREDLDKDLRYFNAEQDKPEASSRPLSQADLLLGSFFFIHESRSGDAGLGSLSDHDASPATFEFLHKTFGEFLTADFILHQVLTQATTVSKLTGDPELREALHKQLESPRESWFGCLVHTPLHDQPNVLTMVREWVGHHLADDNRSRTGLLAALDKVIMTQLRRLLTGTTLPNLASSDQAMPYERLPALGHLAVYSLNLIVLRAYLSDAPYVIDEVELGHQPGGCRAWDRFAAIWRSWFPPESLAALASRLTATRRETQITITAARSPLVVPTTTPLGVAYDASLALADDLTTGSAGLHLASLNSMRMGYLEALRDCIERGAVDLLPVADFALSRISPSASGELSAFAEKYMRRYGREFPSVLAVQNGMPPAGLDLDFVEMANTLAFPARMSMTTKNKSQVKLGGLIQLSRYAAEIAVRYRERLGPVWLSTLLDPRWKLRWDEILATPSGAPLLRAALRELNDKQCFVVAKAISGKLPDRSIEMFDIDTAAAVAVLAWRGNVTELCTRSLELIIQERAQKNWYLLDIPIQTWDGLADLLVSSGEQYFSLRQLLSHALNEELGRLGRGRISWVVLDVRPVPPVEILIQALRIGTSDNPDILNAVLLQIFTEKFLHGDASRRWFLLLIRWARENNNIRLAQQLFTTQKTRQVKFVVQFEQGWREILDVPPDKSLETLDIEKVSTDLTYREAADLRWAIGVAREAGHEHDAGGPRIGTASE